MKIWVIWLWAPCLPALLLVYAVNILEYYIGVCQSLTVYFDEESGLCKFLPLQSSITNYIWCVLIAESASTIVILSLFDKVQGHLRKVCKISS